MIHTSLYSFIYISSFVSLCGAIFLLLSKEEARLKKYQNDENEKQDYPIKGFFSLFLLYGIVNMDVSVQKSVLPFFLIILLIEQLNKEYD